MQEFIEKLNAGLGEELKTAREMQTTQCIGHNGYGTPLQSKLGGEICALLKVQNIVNQLAEEYKDKAIINEQYCFQTCGATEHCKECNRLCNGSIDYYENYDFMAEEHNNGWIPVSERLPVYLDNVLACTKNGGRTIAHLKHTPIEWRDMYMNKIDDVIAWKYLDAPYQPKGE